MEIVLVVAMSENRVIGRDGALPWHIPGDLKHFKAVTMGHPIVMGRKTWESIGRPLPGRENIVISRNPDFRAVGATVVGSLDAAIEEAGKASAERVMVIGGGQIYADALDRASRLEITEVHQTIEGDTVFPAIDEADWVESNRAEPQVAGEGPSYSFVTFVRR